MIVAGVMSGTSLDGIDVALVDLTPSRDGYALRTLAARTTAFDDATRARVAAALPPHVPPPAVVAELDVDLGERIGDAVVELATSTGLRPRFVGSHGLTLYHDGDRGLTVQIGDPYRIRARTDATVVHDFRRADCAAGGCGAPLVPAVDVLLFGSLRERIVALNLGGIANLTLVAADPRDVLAWDAGPGNMLLDAFVAERTGGAERFDRDGAHAARGGVDDALLATLLRDEYLARRPPKSTGRERFGAPFLAEFGAALARLSLADGCATLTAFTAETIARDVRAAAAPGATIVASGGGARNPALLRSLSERLAGFTVATSDAYGIDPDAKEAVAFAVLGYETLRGRSGALPSVTGASRADVLGAIVPHDLATLLADVEAETHTA